MPETPQTGSKVPYVGPDRRAIHRPTDNSTVSLLISRMDDMRDDNRATAREVKGSLEKLADAITALAVLDQQLVTNTQAQVHLAHKVDSIEGRVDVLEQAAPANKRIADWVTAAVWAAAGGGVAITLKIIVSGNLAAVLQAIQ